MPMGKKSLDAGLVNLSQRNCVTMDRDFKEVDKAVGLIADTYLCPALL